MKKRKMKYEIVKNNFLTTFVLFMKKNHEYDLFIQYLFAI